MINDTVTKEELINCFNNNHLSSALLEVVELFEEKYGHNYTFLKDAIEDNALEDGDDPLYFVNRDEEIEEDTLEESQED